MTLARRLLFWSGLTLVIFGVALLILTPVQAASGVPWPAAIWLGSGTLLLGTLKLAAWVYFEFREARRADRAEAREIADRRQRGDDIH